MITTDAALYAGTGTSLLLGSPTPPSTCSCGQELATGVGSHRRHCPRCGCCLS